MSNAVLTTAATAALMWLPLDQLEANEFALRSVDLDDPNVQNLFEDIAARGVQKTLGVRPSTLGNKKDPKLTPDGRQIYAVKDGLHRYSGAVAAKLEQVPCMVQVASDEDVEVSQIMDNLHVIPTKPYEYGAGLKKVLARDTTVTKAELASKLHVSEDFIEARMGLGGLHKDGVDAKGDPTSTLGDLVDKGDICLGNAIALAKLKPTDEQLNFKDQAVTMKSIEFAKLITTRMSDIRKAKQAGKVPGEKVEWKPSANLRKKSDLEAELEHPTNLSALVKAKGLTDAESIIKFVLQYALKLDEQSIIEQKAAHDASEKARLEKMAAAKAERERLQKVADDAVAAAKLSG